MKRSNSDVRKTVAPRRSRSMNALTAPGFQSSFVDSKTIKIDRKPSTGIISDIPNEHYFKDDVLFGSCYPSYTKFNVP